ncbi:glycoside hydrolase family 3 protein [Micromonospora sp. SL1-18]|uniref:beta-glucosidase n=1 Tax=Micromonospora sp. SL1-18 TaxID=3399128 RepID=UPI003A4DDC65
MDHTEPGKTCGNRLSWIGGKRIPTVRCLEPDRDFPDCTARTDMRDSPATRRPIALLATFGILLATFVLSPNAGQAADRHPWMDPKLPPPERAELLVQAMTLDEKILEVHGSRSSEHLRYVAPVERLGIPAFLITNGPLGAGPGDRPVDPPATALPAAIGLASSWDPHLARTYGKLMGEEVTHRGESLLEAPGVNIARVPHNGRNFEYLGEDPYLASRMVVPETQGIQEQGIIAEVKHYAANNHETGRNGINELIDQRTLREIYLPAFEAAVTEGDAGAVMCSYNRVNGPFACEDRHLLTEILRDDWGFKGFVQSDFGATHSTLPSVRAGLDLEMPDGDYYAAPLKSAVEGGQVSEASLDQMLIRRFTQMFKMGLFDHPRTVTPIPAERNGAIARAIGEQSAVLLKNDHHQLPLSAQSINSIAVVGQFAGAAHTGGGGSSHVTPLYTVDPVDGIKAHLKPDTTVNYEPGVETEPLPPVPSSALNPPGQPDVHGLLGEYFTNRDLSGKPALTRVDDQVDFDYGEGSPAPGIPSDRFSVRWTGTLTAPTTGTYTVATTSDDGSRLFIDDSPVVDNWGNHESKTVAAPVPLAAGPHTVRVEYYDKTGPASIRFGWLPPGSSSALEKAADAARHSDIAIVMVGERSAEGSDRPSLSLPNNQDLLVQAVAAANPNTVVVVKSGGAVLMPWIDDVPAVLEAWYPGEEDGNVVANLLFGTANPSGKLSVTFPKEEGDYPANTPEQFPGVNGTAVYSEGLEVGYRWNTAHDVEPLFPFGYGLSYTTFAFKDLAVSPRLTPNGQVNVAVNVTNTGSRTGSEVAQVYLSFPPQAGEPPIQLKGFQKVTLRPGQTKHLTFHLNQRAFSIWNTKAAAWTTVDGTYTVRVGNSSGNLPLQAPVRVDRAAGVQ